MKAILAIDQGTTSTRSIVFDDNANVLGVSQIEHRQIFPQQAWVEHDPMEIKQNVFRTMKEAVEKAGISWDQIHGIGITNQRETIVAWNPRNGIPYHNAIVWQCRRSSQIVDELKKNYNDVFHQKTGLVLDAYFSGTKIKWLIDNNEKIKEALAKREIVFGTIDSWVIYNLTGELKTDVSNASRTLLMDISTTEWSEDLSEILQVPIDSLPEIMPSGLGEGFGEYKIEGTSIPVNGVAGDQQAALFGQGSFEKGENKCTYGTGNFALLNTGSEIKYSNKGLLTTVAWRLGNDSTKYALEGSVFITGAAVQWLRDGLKIISSSPEIEELASKVQDNGGIIIVPAFAGLGAPYWDQKARGLIIGITRGTTDAHIARAVLESIAHQTTDLYEVMKEDAGLNFENIRVDGGATKNKLLLQIQADLLNSTIIRPKNIETTALGAAFLSGLSSGVWSDLSDLKELNPPEATFWPKMTHEERIKQRNKWKKAVKRSIEWEE